MKKKLITIILCVILLCACIIILINTQKINPIYANDINIAPYEFSVNKFSNGKISKNDYTINISPINYNQGIKFNSDNSDVSIDKYGNISYNNISRTSTITVSVKTSANESIYKTIKIVLNGESEIKLEHETITINTAENARIYNRLTLPDNYNVTVSTQNNFISYNYKTGLISIKNLPSSYGYDKVELVISDNNFVEIAKIYFDVILIDKPIITAIDEPVLITFQNPAIDNQNVLYEVTKDNIVTEDYIVHCKTHNSITLSFANDGIYIVKVYSSNFINIFKINVTQNITQN